LASLNFLNLGARIAPNPGPGSGVQLYLLASLDFLHLGAPIAPSPGRDPVSISDPFGPGTAAPQNPKSSVIFVIFQRSRARAARSAASSDGETPADGSATRNPIDVAGQWSGGGAFPSLKARRLRAAD
jgi:hypothetical protein